MGLKEAFCFSCFSSYRISSSAKAAFLLVNLAILRSPSSLLLTPQSDLQCKAQLVKNGKKKETISIHMKSWNPWSLPKGPLTYQFYQFSGPLTLMSPLSTWAPCIMQIDGTCKRGGDGRSKLVASGPRTGARNGHRPGVSQRDEGHRTWTNRTHRTHRTHGTHGCHWGHQWAHRSH